ncbi:MAG: hypothetical protein WBA16_05310 [Nonlabens sp.]
MKKITYILLVTSLIIVMASCATKKTSRETTTADLAKQGDTIRIANDSLEYEIIIIEPGFYGWLASQPPEGHYAQTTMELRNRLDVLDYNLRVRDPIRYDANLYPFPIEYRRDVDYGYEVNYLLFNYFIFFKQKYRQRFR